MRTVPQARVTMIKLPPHTPGHSFPKLSFPLVPAGNSRSTAALVHIVTWVFMSVQLTGLMLSRRHHTWVSSLNSSALVTVTTMCWYRSTMSTPTTLTTKTNGGSSSFFFGLIFVASTYYRPLSRKLSHATWNNKPIARPEPTRCYLFVVTELVDF